ncbi:MULTISPECIES: ATP-dependent protease subunit HslV [Bacillaceae]|jgi:ATP-dependent HslUV protease subunit HslV|uniref:ATP-dependent protease subunit HslV n=2 Tax=Gottfriedia TaxID=2837503 RepID=A0ABY4JGU4_9BACI|nr:MULTISPECIES: ATP-dependent protease subunit HslV [Bacillaceae]KQL39440.1 ATP-dependent protease subunit HslV [Bacillus sp. FJAT-25509]ODG91173.1 HslU--HslV peptidase proteolytic subunit [Gottfriedia luciferensis]PEC49744.1 ATP-dependent protease subunit HslV [Bacillus sp. AFS096315]PFH89414.1 ATP-dependent protease subunit HslV [Bacillus sp. AFS088145]PFM79581.1 ATP-dependent protease subunit HslV [Bacillus sp. AFS077874]
MSNFHATTIFAIRHDGKSAMAGDGQVTFGNAVVMKHTARKVRKLFNGKVLAGFAGSVADAFTLFELFEGKLVEYNGNIQRAAVELAKKWRTDRVLHKLEALLIVMDHNSLLLISGTGEVIEPDDGILAIGSGGNYALAAGRALKENAGENLSAKQIAYASLKTASDICVYTNGNIILEELE